MAQTFKQLDPSNDVIVQSDQVVQYQWSISSNAVGTDDSGNKWTDTSMSSYITHAVASAGNTALVKNSDGSPFDGDMTSEELYHVIGTQYFNLNNPADGFSWSEGSAVKKMYVVLIDSSLTLDKIKPSTFSITLSGYGANNGTPYRFVLNVPADDPYPYSTTIRYADEHGALSATNVGVAFLDDGVLCFMTKGDETGASGLLNATFGSAPVVTQSNLPNFFTAAGAGTCQAVSANSVEYKNSFIYFCRAMNREFNYSLNPTFSVTASSYVGSYRVRSEFEDEPKTFITGVGLFDSSNNLLAVAKLSVPRQKDFYSEALFKVKLTI